MTTMGLVKHEKMAMIQEIMICFIVRAFLAKTDQAEIQAAMYVQNMKVV